MADQVEAEGTGDPLLLTLDVVILEFEDKAALDADQVVVVLCVTGGLVHRLPLAEATMGREAALGQELEGPVDRRVADPGALLAGQREELLDADMTVSGEELLGDQIALPRRLQLILREIRMELLHEALDVALVPALTHRRWVSIATGRLRQALQRRKHHPYTPRPMARAKKTPTKPGLEAEAPLAIDEVLRQLEEVVQELEGGEVPLETALGRFEVGVRLARQGGKLLDGIEERVEVLLADRDEAVPFATDLEGGDDA